MDNCVDATFRNLHGIIDCSNNFTKPLQYDREVYKPGISRREEFIPHLPNITHPTLVATLALPHPLYIRALLPIPMAYFNNGCNFYSNASAAGEPGNIYPFLNVTPAAEETGSQLPNPPVTHWDGFGQPDPMVGSWVNLPTPTGHGKWT